MRVVTSHTIIIYKLVSIYCHHRVLHVRVVSDNNGGLCPFFIEIGIIDNRGSFDGNSGTILTVIRAEGDAFALVKQDVTIEYVRSDAAAITHGNP